MVSWTAVGGEGGQVIQKHASQETSKAINTDWFASNITPTNAPCVHRITIKMVSDTVVKLEVDDGTNSNIEWDLNGGNVLTGGSVYTFDIPIPLGWSYNIQHETSTQNFACVVVELQTQTG